MWKDTWAHKILVAFIVLMTIYPFIAPCIAVEYKVFCYTQKDSVPSLFKGWAGAATSLFRWLQHANSARAVIVMIYDSLRLKCTVVSINDMTKYSLEKKIWPWRLRSHVEFSATSLSERSLFKWSLQFTMRGIMKGKAKLLIGSFF